MKCTFTKSDGTQCKANAVFNSNYCWYHNPDIPDEIKRSVSSKGGKTNSAPEIVESSLPIMKIKNVKDIVALLEDTINNMRQGKISKNFGSSFGYLSFIMLLAMEKVVDENKRERVEKLKSEGKWPEPIYASKLYTYKDMFYLDKDGNPLIVEKNSSDFQPEKVIKKKNAKKVSKKVNGYESELLDDEKIKTLIETVAAARDTI